MDGLAIREQAGPGLAGRQCEVACFHPIPRVDIDVLRVGQYIAPRPGVRRTAEPNGVDGRAVEVTHALRGR